MERIFYAFGVIVFVGAVIFGLALWLDGDPIARLLSVQVLIAGVIGGFVLIVMARIVEHLQRLDAHIAQLAGSLARGRRRGMAGGDIPAAAETVEDEEGTPPPDMEAPAGQTAEPIDREWSAGPPEGGEIPQYRPDADAGRPADHGVPAGTGGQAMSFSDVAENGGEAIAYGSAGGDVGADGPEYSALSGAEPAQPADGPQLVRVGSWRGHELRVYDDGSVSLATDGGWRRFGSIRELHDFLIADQ